jgi:SAM-dependent methyltransferase
MTDRKTHWETVYTTKRVTEVGWYQPDPRISLELIESVLPPRGRVIDVGGGASVLVDRLIHVDHGQIAVLDISAAALEEAQSRLAGRAAEVRWIVGDVTTIGDVGQFDLWHDRAVFHFLINPEDRHRYVELAARTLPQGGHLVIGTFALDGPPRCSGLDVRRYDADLLIAELDSSFRLVRQERETHTTPTGKPQAFLFTLFVRM